MGTGRLDKPKWDGEGEQVMEVVKVVFGMRKIEKDSGMVGRRRYGLGGDEQKVEESPGEGNGGEVGGTCTTGRRRFTGGGREDGR